MSKSIFIRLMISVIVVLILSSSFYLPEAYALGDVFQAGSDFLSKGNTISQTIDTTALKTTSDYIYNTLLAIAIMVAVVVSMVLGIQFMVASADEKAKVKEALMPFVVGCIVVFGSFTIWKVAVNIGNKAEGPITLSGSLEEQAAENHRLYEKIENGEIGEFSDQQVRDVYSGHRVADDLRSKTTRDTRAGADAPEPMSLPEAIEDLSDYKKTIYNEAKARGLLKDDGINLK